MGSMCAGCTVRERSLCGVLADKELAALSLVGRRRRYERGEVVIWAGDEAGLCANVLSGVLKITASTSDGREQIVGLLYPGDFFGHPYMSLSEYTITALSAVEVCLFPRRAFEQVLQNNVQMERLLLKRTLSDLGRARAWMLLLGRMNAQERVASFLVDMARRLGSDTEIAPSTTFELPITRGEIADVISELAAAAVSD